MYPKFLLTALLALLFTLVSCDKDNDLQPTPVTNDDAQKEQPTIDKTAADAAIELKAAAQPTGFVKPGAINVYYGDFTVAKGKWHMVYYRKAQLGKNYRYVCKVTPKSGNPNLYVLIRENDGDFRYIRYAPLPGLLKEQSSGSIKDFSTSKDDRLYFGVYGVKNSTFTMEIWAEPLECTRIVEDFESYQVGQRLSVQSSKWSAVQGSKEGKVVNSTGVRRKVLQQKSGEAIQYHALLTEGSRYRVNFNIDLKEVASTHIGFYENGAAASKEPKIKIELVNNGKKKQAAVLHNGALVTTIDMSSLPDYNQVEFNLVFDFRTNTMNFNVNELGNHTLIKHFTMPRIRSVVFSVPSRPGQEMKLNSLSILESGC